MAFSDLKTVVIQNFNKSLSAVLSKIFFASGIDYALWGCLITSCLLMITVKKIIPIPRAAIAMPIAQLCLHTWAVHGPWGRVLQLH